MELSLYRITQEALTNVVKHAGATEVRVAFTRQGRHIVLCVEDNGVAAAAAATRTDVGGAGHVGMRERAAVFGGTVAAGPRIGGGYAVDCHHAPRAGAVTIRVLIADDQHLVRAGFRYLLDAEPDLTVVGEAADGQGSASAGRDRRPRRRGHGHPDAGHGRHRGDPPAVGARSTPAVLVLTTFDADVYLYEALRAGAGGFLLKDAPPEQLTAAVRTVAAGDALLAPALTRRLVERFLEQPPTAGTSSPRLQSLDRARAGRAAPGGRGRSNQEIAAELFLAETTVKTHLGRVLAKTRCRDRLQAVVLGYETGLVRPGAG